jgi:hypothetical protein
MGVLSGIGIHRRQLPLWLQVLSMPAIAALWYWLFGEQKAERNAEWVFSGDMSSLAWQYVILIVVLFLVATHGCTVNPLTPGPHDW